MNTSKMADIPAGPYNKAKRVRLRNKIFELMPDGRLYNKDTDRSMTPETFEIYKIASAKDGIQIVIKSKASRHANTKS